MHDWVVLFQSWEHFDCIYDVFIWINVCIAFTLTGIKVLVMYRSRILLGKNSVFGIWNWLFVTLVVMIVNGDLTQQSHNCLAKMSNSLYVCTCNCLLLCSSACCSMRKCFAISKSMWGRKNCKNGAALCVADWLGLFFLIKVALLISAYITLFMSYLRQLEWQFANRNSHMILWRFCGRKV